MDLIFEGELRAFWLLVAERETILATLGPGDFFGDLSLSRAALGGLVAKVDSTVLKMSTADI